MMINFRGDWTVWGAMLLGLGATGVAAQTTVNWQSGGATTLSSDRANWSDNTLPGATDTGHFWQDAIYAVTADQGASFARAVVSDGVVTWNFAVTSPSPVPLDDAWQLTQTGLTTASVSLLVGKNVDTAGSLTITGGLVRSQSVIVAGLAGVPARLVVNGPGAELQATGSAVWTEIGGEGLGAGEMQVINGGKVTSNSIRVGTASDPTGGRGVVLVRGVGSEWSGGAFFLGTGSGNLNPAEIRIDQGGSVSSAYLDNRSRSLIEISGTGSHWEVNGGLTFRNGEARIEDGGRITASVLELGQSSVSGLSSHAVMVVSGRDATDTPSTVAVASLNLGRSYSSRTTRGLLQVTDGGRVTVTQTVQLGHQSAVGTGVLEVSGTGSRFEATGTTAARGIFVGGTSAAAVGQGYLTVTNGGVIAAASVSGVLLYADGHLSGDGTVEGLVENRGLVAPGMRFTLAPEAEGGTTLFLRETRGTASTLTITGDFLQTAAGRLELLLGPGAGSDRLVVGGAFTFGGTLALSLAHGYDPVLGTSFDLFDFGSASGTFATVSLPTLGTGLGWDTTGLYTTGTIVVSASPIPEPGAWAAWVGMAVLAWAGYRRRREGPGQG